MTALLHVIPYLDFVSESVARLEQKLRGRWVEFEAIIGTSFRLGWSSIRCDMSNAQDAMNI